MSYTIIETNKIPISFNNSTQVLLGPNEIFTGVADEVCSFINIYVDYYSDVKSADSGISLQFSDDINNWDTPKTYSYTSILNPVNNQYLGNFVSVCYAKYFRIVYTNGPTTQTSFSLQTTFYQWQDPAKIVPTSIITNNQITSCTRLTSNFKRDLAIGLISNSSNFIINADQSIDNTTKVLANISSSVYQWPTTAQKVRVAAGGNASDVYGGVGANLVKITGLDADFNQVTDVIGLVGASASAWSTNSYIRINQCVVYTVGTYSGSNVGEIIIVNQDDNYQLISIQPGSGRALTSVYTIPIGYSAVIPRIAATVSGSPTDITGHFRPSANKVTPPYAPSFEVNTMYGVSDSIEFSPKELICFIGPTDFWTTATNTGSAKVSLAIDIELIKNT